MTLPTRFKILAVPWGGPIPRNGAPDGTDLDGEYFSRRTETGLSAHAERPLLFHHGNDPLRFMANARIGVTRNWHRSERGWIADVELNADDPRVELLQHLSNRVELFGSTRTTEDGRVIGQDGEILRWPVTELSLSPTPQNPFAIILS